MEGGARTAGPLARGARTRIALAEAMIELLQEGEPAPTARQIAERAGVSLRLVFHHFDDLEALYEAAAAIQFERHWRHVHQPPAGLPFERRVVRLVGDRAKLYEAISAVRRAGLRVEHRSGTVARHLAATRQHLRAQTLATFAPELEDLDPATARVAADALDVATSWETWDQLRRQLGRSPAAARRTVVQLVTAVVDQARSGVVGTAACSDGRFGVARSTDGRGGRR